MTIRPATAAEVRSFYERVGVPVRMVAMECDGEVLGVAGLAWCDDGVHAVSALKPGARRHRTQILRGAHVVQAMAEEMGCMVYATPDPAEPTAAGLLKHLGFEPQEGGLYAYRPEPV
jgi:hypothetical protein